MKASKKIKVGRPPGTLDHIGDKRALSVKITATSYGPDYCEERVCDSLEEALKLFDESRITWINIDGVHDTELLERIGTQFGIDSLVLEDILNTEHRPKVEDHESYIYVILKMLTYDQEQHTINSEQISIIWGRNYVLSFQEVEGDVLDPVRKRLKNPSGRFRRTGSDYLAYAIIDTIVDHYFVVAELVKDFLDVMEQEFLDSPDPENLQKLHRLKSENVFLRRNVWPLREIIGEIERSESNLIDDANRKYFRDTRDHVIQIMDNLESIRDLIAGLHDLNLNMMSNKMNDIMKVLTIIATIFIPLTFIAGLYGMNFEFMPELSWPFGYPLALGFMAVIGIAMFLFFKVKNWI